MLVKFFACKTAWLKLIAFNTDRPTSKTPRSCYDVICESKKGGMGRGLHCMLQLSLEVIIMFQFKHVFFLGTNFFKVMSNFNTQFRKY